MIAVVHLVWGPLVPQALREEGLREFLASYDSQPAGIEHELVIILNGLTPAQKPGVLAMLEGVDHRLLDLPAPVSDVAAYLQAAQLLAHERLLFLNSYSAFLAPQWLAKLDGALDQPECGAAGATGLWGSFHSAALNGLFLPNAYRKVAVPSRSVTFAEDERMSAELQRRRSGERETPPLQAPRRRTLAGRVLSTLRAWRPIPGQVLRFPAFPNPYLRTNAFMVRRATVTSLRTGRLASKHDAFLLECGRASITRQVHAQGLRTLVVDRDGNAWDHTRWPDSNTFWQGRQQGLLVSDNRTEVYDAGSLDRRRVLSVFAWAKDARPDPPARPDS